MIDRRTFLASLFAPFLGWLKPTRTPVAQFPTELKAVMSADGSRCGFIEFPERIENVVVRQDHLYVFTRSGMYEVLGNGQYEKPSYPFAVLVPPLQIPYLPYFALRAPRMRP